MWRLALRAGSTWGWGGGGGGFDGVGGGEHRGHYDDQGQAEGAFNEAMKAQAAPRTASERGVRPVEPHWADNWLETVSQLAATKGVPVDVAMGILMVEG